MTRNGPIKSKNVYNNLIKDLNLKAEEVPLLAGEVVNADQHGQCARMNSIIDELPKTIPNSYVISSARLHRHTAGPPAFRSGRLPGVGESDMRRKCFHY